MFSVSKNELLATHYHPPEFEVELRDEIFLCIVQKTNADSERAMEWSNNITKAIGYISSAFEDGFINEIDARVGNDVYGVRVYLRREESVQN